MVQTSLIVLAVPADVGVKAGAAVWLVALHGAVAWCSFKVIKSKGAGRIKFGTEPYTKKGFCERHVKGPLQIAWRRMVQKDPAGVNKGEWSAGDESSAAQQRFVGGYSELFSGYDDRNALYFLWEHFLEKFIRVRDQPPEINYGPSRQPALLTTTKCCAMTLLIATCVAVLLRSSCSSLFRASPKFPS